MACPHSDNSAAVPDQVTSISQSPPPNPGSNVPAMTSELQSYARFGYMAAMCKDLTHNLSTHEQSAIDAMTNMQHAHSLSHMSGHYLGQIGGNTGNMPGYAGASGLATHIPYLPGLQADYHQPRFLPPVSSLAGITPHNVQDVEPLSGLSPGILPSAGSSTLNTQDTRIGTMSAVYAGTSQPSGVFDSMSAENHPASGLKIPEDHGFLEPLSPNMTTNKIPITVKPLMPEDLATITDDEKDELYSYHLEHPSQTYDQIAKYLSREWSKLILPSNVKHVLAAVQAKRKQEDVLTQPQLESALCQWVADVSLTDCTITDEILVEKVKQLATELQITDFQVSPSWLTEFKQQYGILKMPPHTSDLKYEQETPLDELQSDESWKQLEDLKPDVEQLVGNAADDVTDYGRISHLLGSNVPQPIQDVLHMTTAAEERSEDNQFSSSGVEHDEGPGICDVFKTLCTVTLQEARDGLHNAITYLEANPKVARGHLKTLEKVLKSIDIHARKIEKEAKSQGAKSQKARDLLSTQALMGIPGHNKIYKKNVKSTAVSMDVKLDPENPKKCTVCGKVCGNVHNLRVHMKIHSNDGGLPSVHPENPNKCSVCNKVYSSLNNLRTHQRTHTGERPFLCTICGSSFAQLSSLHGHMVTHISEKSVKCPVCNKAFTCQRYLKTHLLTHSADKPFMCSLCGHCFLRNSDLRLHMRVHTGYKPYKCTMCDKAFSRFSMFQQHERTHTGEKPYKCTTCGLSFAQPQSLKKHIRVHTGERPFKCAICGKSFSQSGSLYHHKKTHKQQQSHDSMVGANTQSVNILTSQ